MVELDKPTISLDASATHNPKKPAKRFFRRRPIWPALRGWGIALLVLTACSWGIWKLTHSSVNTAEDESVADLEGFENAPAFQRSGEQEGPQTLQLGTATSLLAPPRDEMPTLGAGMLGAPARNDGEEGSHVRLTGTIEEDTEPLNQIEMPSRMSGGRDNSIILR